MFGRDRSRIRILGDIISPLETDWDEERELALIQGKDPDKPSIVPNRIRSKD